MHVLGKVFAFLVVIEAIIAGALTAKLVQVRNSWTAKVAASKAKYVELAPKIEDLHAKIDNLRNEIFRSRELWGSYLPNVDTGNPQADGTLSVNIGTDKGIRPNMLLHGFEVDANGATVYRGSFLVADSQPGASTLKPNFRITPEDVKSWKGGNWRWRNAVPAGYLETFDKQLLAILKGDETLKARDMLLADQKRMLENANNTLKKREAELVGGEGLAKAESVGPEFREGLVAALEQSEEDRNQTLLKIDELRRAVREIQADIERLQAENLELIEKLPEPSSPAVVTPKVTQKR
jgi:hypothetical protein